ncbi:MAG: TonB family protein [Alistipes sp.]|nr:TonB family protein [Alistipes sp.]
MFDFVVYLAESSLCLAALYLIYKVSMSYETLHRFNRVLLLGSVALSAVLPLCSVKIVKEYDPAPTVAAVEIEDMVVGEVSALTLGIDYISLLKETVVLIFILGVAFMVVRMAVSLYSVWRLVNSGRISVIADDVTLTVVDNLSSPFSWFGHIVVSESDIEQSRDMILAHELAHIRLRHSWDVIVIDLALCLWWFNPAMWLLRRELQSLHEYQADEAVLSSGVDAKTYQMLLIKRAVGARLHSVANCLNHSNLKNRITMMCKKNSSRWSAAKALFVLPMVAVSLAATATTVYVPREVQDKVTENSANEQPENVSVVKMTGDEIYLNGKKITESELREIAELGAVTLEASKDVRMGAVNDLKEVLREAGVTKLSYGVSEDEPIYVIDGKIVSRAEIEKLPTENIGDMQIYKNKSELPKELNISEEDAKNGVVVIKTKKAGEERNGTMTHIQTISLVGSEPKPEPKSEQYEQTKKEFQALFAELEKKIDALGSQQEELAKNPELLKQQEAVLMQMSKELEALQERLYKIAEAEVKEAKSESEENTPYLMVEKMPTFKGGNMNDFCNWVQSNVKYPKEAMDKSIQGRVVFSFVVERDGSMSEFEVLQSPDKILADEVERVFKTSPKWEPGEQAGEKVRVKYTVPVVFQVN